MRSEYDLSKLTPVPPEKQHWRKRDRVVIDLAPTDRVDQLAPEIEKVLEALGHPEALVTDQSAIGDFGVMEQHEIDWIAGFLGVEVQRRDYLVTIAQRLRDKG